MSASAGSGSLVATAATPNTAALTAAGTPIAIGGSAASATLRPAFAAGLPAGQAVRLRLAYSSDTRLLLGADFSSAATAPAGQARRLLAVPAVEGALSTAVVSGEPAVGQCAGRAVVCMLLVGCWGWHCACLTPRPRGCPPPLLPAGQVSVAASPSGGALEVQLPLTAPYQADKVSNSRSAGLAGCGCTRQQQAIRPPLPVLPTPPPPTQAYMCLRLDGNDRWQSGGVELAAIATPAAPTSATCRLASADAQALVVLQYSPPAREGSADASPAPSPPPPSPRPPPTANVTVTVPQLAFTTRLVDFTPQTFDAAARSAYIAALQATSDGARAWPWAEGTAAALAAAPPPAGWHPLAACPLKPACPPPHPLLAVPMRVIITGVRSGSALVVSPGRGCRWKRAASACQAGCASATAAAAWLAP